MSRSLSPAGRASSARTSSTSLVAAGHGRASSTCARRLGTTPSEVETVLGDLRRPRRRDARAREAATRSATWPRSPTSRQVADEPADADRAQRHAAPSTCWRRARQRAASRVIYASTIWVYSDVDADEVDEDTLLGLPGAPLHRDQARRRAVLPLLRRALRASSPRSCASASPTGRAPGPRRSIPSFVAQGAAQASRSRSPATASSSARSSTSRTSPRASCARSRRRAAGRDLQPRRARDGHDPRPRRASSRATSATSRSSTPRAAPATCAAPTIRSDRAERELGWRATTPLREGVRRYADWLAPSRRHDPEPRRVAALSRPGGRSAQPRRPLCRRRARAEPDRLRVGDRGRVLAPARARLDPGGRRRHRCDAVGRDAHGASAVGDGDRVAARPAAVSRRPSRC